ncbi:MAG: UDP-N-acetylmuramate--L-alanine ligase [Lachnospiraceae bacterium]|nr:UDP-N-acetylmuramate--L-alanine ligase [Lachnospiraceae bacterium]
MYKIDFNNPIHIYFMGIGGISMSGLAEILLDEGFTVSGSDMKETALTKTLTGKGAFIFYGQCPENLNRRPDVPDIDLVVYTAAIKDDNPEFIAMKEKNLKSITRADLLGQIMKNYDKPIAIAGTHGKTTTTGMVSEILLTAGLDPTLSIGGILNSIKGNLRIGKSEYFVTEACEYTNSFLSFFPKIGIILNIEADHLDFFKDVKQIRKSFHDFAALLPEDGLLIINGDIDEIAEVTSGLKCKVITYGLNPSYDYYASDISYDNEARPTFTIKSKPIADVKAAELPLTADKYTLGSRGEHNVMNALSAIALSDFLGINPQDVKEALKKFTGTKRRFEEKGKCAGFTIVDDYAHHPTEIEATLKTARNYPHRDIWCVFQPHTYTRTKVFIKEFAAALSLADKIIVTDIYAAREKNTTGISAKDLADKVSSLGKECYYLPTADSFEAAEKFILKNLKKDDLLITMGAGDVVNIGDNLLKK